MVVGPCSYTLNTQRFGRYFNRVVEISILSLRLQVSYSILITTSISLRPSSFITTNALMKGISEIIIESQSMNIDLERFKRLLLAPVPDSSLIAPQNA